MRRPPDTSVGPLMDARDRRERLGAWITLAWLGLFALGVRIGIGYLPPVPEKDPFEGITLTKVNEPTTLEDLNLSRRPIDDGSRYLAWRTTDHYSQSPVPVIVDIEKREIVARLSEEASKRSLLPGDDGNLIILASAVTDNLQSRTANFLQQVGMPPFIPEERCGLVGELSLSGGGCGRIGRLPESYAAPNFSTGSDRALHSMENTMSFFAPWFQNGGFYPTSSLVDVGSGRVLKRLPIPGRAWFLGDNAALCLSPYGVARVDLQRDEYEIVYPIEGTHYPETGMTMTVPYLQDDRRFLGAFFWDIERRSPFALRIELSDPPRVERLAPSLQEFERKVEVTPYSSAWTKVEGMNYARGLLLARIATWDPVTRMEFHVLESSTGRTIYSREAVEMSFIGSDHLRIREKVDLPQLAGPVAPMDESTERHIEMAMSLGNGDVVQTTRTMEVFRYIRLDDLIPKEEKR